MSESNEGATSRRESPGPAIVVPEGFTLHTENNSHILISSKDEAFLNPVQEFNRDLSVACIRVWSEELNREKEEKWKQAEKRRAQRLAKAAWKAPDAETGGETSQPAAAPADSEDVSMSDVVPATDSENKSKEYRPYKFVLLEALSATGLRSIRYAKEIPLVRYVIANDLSPSATAAMRRNIELNRLGPNEVKEAPSAEGASETDASPKQPWAGKVRVNEGDACALMYNHRAEKYRVDVVDLDPYGTAAPFIDAAVQCVNDGGLLCVTCTDLAVLATTNYSEKCFANYGGIPMKTEYCHEVALRLVLNSISTSAAKYGRYIEPMLSLSVDFYVRLFIRVHTAPVEVKKAASKTSTFYVCSGCQSYHEQKLGRIVEKVNERSGKTDVQFKTVAGPPVSAECSECGFTHHVAGPMWSGPLHDAGFVSKVLGHLQKNQHKYGTSTRMKGMLTVAQEELDVPFYFTPAKIAGTFHCSTPALDDVASALLNAGHKISRSHACPGSMKTTASREDVHDIFRSWIKLHPVRMDRIAEKSPASKLLSKEPKEKANFKKHPDSVTRASHVKLVRYQQNPAPNWGPGSKAFTGQKRKREDDP